MIARTMPVGVKLQPDPPKSSDEIRLQQLREKLQRLLAGANRVNAEIIELERQLKDAA